MSTATLTPSHAGGQPAGATRSTWKASSKLSFGGVLRSEWIKLSSLRSTWWSLGSVIVMALAMSFLMASIIEAQGAIQADTAPSAVMVGTYSISLTSLIAAVLGVLVISGEYSTGMIRSTLTAVPKRLPALWAKGTILFVSLFVTGLVTSFGGFLLTQGMRNANGLTATLADEGVVLALLNGGLFLGLIGLMAFGIGTIVRSGAGGIAISVGILMVLPIVANILVSVGWDAAIMDYLPSMAGQVMYSIPMEGMEGMEYWQALLVVLGWVVVTLVPAAILLKRRDA